MRDRRKKWMWLLAVMFCLAGCGGGGGGTSDGTTPADTLTLTGTVNAPAAASPSISKNLSKAVSDAAAASVGGHIYTLDGEDCGTFTTAADGTFSLAVDPATLAGSDDTADAGTEAVILDADNGIQNYVEVTWTADSTAVSLGTADTDTTLAAQGLASNIPGFAGWGQAYRDLVSNLDLGCIFAAQEAMWESVALDGEGLSDDQAIIKETIMAFMAEGGSPADAGFSSWSDMMGAILDGSADDSGAWSTISSTASGAIDDQYDAAIASGYGAASQAFSAFDGLFASQFASGGAGLAANLAVKSEGESGSICDSIEAGTLDPAAFVKPMLATDDLESFELTYGDDEGILVHFAFLEECMASNSCAEMANEPGAYFGFMDGYAGDFSDIYEDGAFDDTALGGAFMAAGSCSGSTWEEMADCSKAMHGTIYDGAGGDWSQFMSEGSFDSTEFEAQAGYWMGQIEGGFDPEGEGFSDDFYASAYEQMEGMDADAVQTCIDYILAQGGFDTSSCYGNFQDFDDLGGYSGTEQYDQPDEGELFQPPPGYEQPPGDMMM